LEIRKELNMVKVTLRSSWFLVVLAGLAVAGFAQTIQVNPNNRTIAVTVSDKASTVADVATVHIGFEAYAADADSAYTAGTQVSNAIIDALHKAGVEDKAIESESQLLQQNVQFDDKEPEADRAKRRFVLTQSWTVKTTAADAAKVLHVAVEAGANNSGAIDWDLKDRPGLQAQAAAKALEHARAIADQMAKGLNTHLGALIYASNEAPPQGFGQGSGGGYGGGMIMTAVKAIPLAISPQKIEESATVYAVFAIQ
jgi:uncharacterized protein